jgi:hypothetical protein
MQIDDEFSAGLDIAMAVRRAGLQGAATPDGVLTRFEKTTIGRFVKEIEAKPDSATIDIGLLLLSLSETAVTSLSRVADSLAARTRADGKVHDASFSFKRSSGITFHCTDEPSHVAGPRLAEYCKLRKYKERAKEWFGLCISSKGPDVRFGVELEYGWSQDAAMDERTSDMKAPTPAGRALSALRDRTTGVKIGRNDACPCGSGRKFKKCCLGRI